MSFPRMISSMDENEFESQGELDVLNETNDLLDDVLKSVDDLSIHVLYYVSIEDIQYIMNNCEAEEKSVFYSSLFQKLCEKYKMNYLLSYCQLNNVYDDMRLIYSFIEYIISRKFIIEIARLLPQCPIDRKDISKFVIENISDLQNKIKENITDELFMHFFQNADSRSAEEFLLNIINVYHASIITEQLSQGKFL